MSALYPNVPFFPGVPSVFRDASNASNVIEAVDDFQLSQDALASTGASRTVWGLYDENGVLALEPDSIFALEPMREFRLSDYPVEDGGFQTFNKVATPAETRITMTKGGTDADRQSFLDRLDEIIETTKLFSIVTSDKTFIDRNVTHYNYRRTAESGATLLTIEIHAMEVRQSATAAFTNSKSPSGADTINNGPVQPELAPIDQRTPVATPADEELVAFQSVPIVATPAQTMSVTLGNQPTKLFLKQKQFGLFVDVLVNDVLVIGGVRALNNNVIVRSAYLSFAGDLLFRDLQGRSDPHYDQLGGRFALFYATSQAAGL